MRAFDIEKMRVRFIWDLEFYGAGHKKKPDNMPLGGVLCIGNFDGLHAGHREVIKTGKGLAQKFSAPFIIISFVPHPRLILRPENFFILSPLDIKLKKLEILGVDLVVIFNFISLVNMEPETFCSLIDFVFKPQGIVVGFDFTFGKGGRGKVEDIRRYFGDKAHIEVVPSVSSSYQKISSSLLRKIVTSGDVWSYIDYTESPYLVRGVVVKGAGRGREIGFPTANVVSTYQLPADGVYACQVNLENMGNFWGVCNVGTQPTFGSQKRTLEVFIFDFNKNIYGHPIDVMFIKRIRDVQKFSSPDELKRRIEEDVKIAFEIIQMWQKEKEKEG